MDWSVLNPGTVDEACETFTGIFIDLAKQCIPTSFVTIRPYDRPWYDSEIRRTSRKRDRIKKKAIQTENVFCL